LRLKIFGILHVSFAIAADLFAFGGRTNFGGELRGRPEARGKVQIMRRAGVTIVEVVLVIVMVAAAIGLILPAVLRVRENSAKMETNNKLKECAFAVRRSVESRRAGDTESPKTAA
jgi:hypothetical protein